jgi:hypothetical protein
MLPSHLGVLPCIHTGSAGQHLVHFVDEANAMHLV